MTPQVNYYPLGVPSTTPNPQIPAAGVPNESQMREVLFDALWYSIKRLVRDENHHFSSQDPYCHLEDALYDLGQPLRGVLRPPAGATTFPPRANLDMPIRPGPPRGPPPPSIYTSNQSCQWTQNYTASQPQAPPDPLTGTHPQDPLQLFMEFVTAVSAGRLLQSKYPVAVQMLCKEAPCFAQFLKEEIPKHLKEGGETDDNYPNFQESGTIPAQSQNGGKPSGLPYRPPKSGKAGERLGVNEVERSCGVAGGDTTEMSYDRVPASEISHRTTATNTSCDNMPQGSTRKRAKKQKQRGSGTKHRRI
ncbi:hypothetical protein DL769_001498 [Monosporascus sp. CRB-8-3]|nr:hypothetical protein DL769_001498 [Monosporascus sp. CRB-8-3]